MIDLRNKELPSHITWDGGSCAINTDFREWIKFGEYLKTKMVYLGVFPNFKAPAGDKWQLALFDFYLCKNDIPRSFSHSDVRTIDLIIDGDSIVASFQQAYGIDLTSIEYMHWHRFKALLAGLPDDTKMSKIMGYRSWSVQDSKRKHDDIMQEQRAAWMLPLGDDIEEEDLTGGFAPLLRSMGLM